MGPGRTWGFPQRTFQAFAISGRTAITALTVDTSAVVTAALAEGYYQVFCADRIVYIAVDPVSATADNVTSSTGLPLPQAVAAILYIPQGHFLAAIAGGAGTLTIFKVD